MTKPKGLIIYDMDGVVMDNISECFVTFRGTLEEFRGPTVRLPTFRVFLEAFSNPPHQFYSQFGVLWSEAEKVFRILAETYFRTEGLYLGVVESITRLRIAGYKTAIVSSGYSEVVEKRFSRFRLANLFDEVTTGQSTKVQALQLCHRRLLCSPDQTFFVGDLKSDMRDAKLAGVRGIGFSADNWFMRPVLIQAGAECCVDSHEELTNLLLAA